MKKLLKIFAVLIVLLVAIAFVAPSFISSDMLKQKLTEQVKAATGRTLTIGGDVKLKFFPVAGVTANDVSLSGLSKEKPLVSLKSLDVNVEVMPLFSKQLVVKGLHLDNPAINLDVAESGAQSWVFETASSEPAVASEQKSAGVPLPVQNIALADVKISNGTVSFHNTQTGDKWNIGALDVNVSMDSLSKPLKFKSSAKVDGKDVAVSGDMSCTGKTCQFANAELRYDTLRASGVIGVDYGKSVPFISVKLKTGELDLNPFLPPQQQKQAGFSLIADAFAATGWSRAPMDFSGLRKINMEVQVEAARVQAYKMHVENTVLKANLKNAKLRADVTDADIYGGKGSIAVALDSIGANVEKSASMRGVQAEPFLRDAMSEEHLSGTLDMDMSVAGRGRTQYEIVNSLQGKGAVKFTDGSIKGVDIAGMVRNVQSAFKEVDTSSQKTDFAELGGTFTITNGIAKNNDLHMKAPLMRLSGEGQADLPNRTVNYRLKPEIVQTIQGQGGKEKEGLGVPIIVSGTFDHLTWSPDLQAVVTDVINNPKKAKEAVKDIKEQFNKENRKETIKNLKGLLR